MKNRRLTVLVVEADLPLALQYQLELISDGHHVSIVHNAEDALSLVALGCDLVITDLSLPGMSGEAFIQTLRARPEHADLPVLVISAAIGIPESLRHALTQFRRKPFALDRLSDYAQEAAGSSRFRN